MKGKAISYYTKVNGLFLKLISQISLVTSNSDIAQRLAAYYEFLQSKERAGIERAVLTGVFSEGSLMLSLL